MSKAPATSQQKHPWRATARTVLEWLIGAVIMAPAIYEAVAAGEPAAATGWAATALAISAAVTRIVAHPWVDKKLARLGLGSVPRAALVERKRRGYSSGNLVSGLEDPHQHRS